MKTVPQILIVLLLITKNLAQDEETLQNSEITTKISRENTTIIAGGLDTVQYITTEHSVINVILETTSKVTTDVKEITGETATTISLSDNEVHVKHEIVSEDSNKLKNEKAVETEINPSENEESVSQLENGNEAVTKISISDNEVYSDQEKISEDFNKLDNEETEITVKSPLESKVHSEQETVSGLESGNEAVTKISFSDNEVYSEQEIVSENSNNLESVNEVVYNISNKTETNNEEIVSKTVNEELPNIIKILKPLTNNQEEIKDNSEKSTESITTSKQEDILDNSENSTESLIEDATTTVVNELKPKSLTTLEDYALKQMNFILDNLLIETQEFIAKVLQASVNMVFQRDHLKRYAEGLNRILNPDTDSEYSDEIIEDSKILTQDELYEEIILKLNFLKSKPSRYLQRHLPQNWIKEYLNKREELIIWLDKASEQMHQEFNLYVNEEDDYIKYQYFNEAFDDISRATEIHQKLALLADLVQIVKNKKQITFMDLYMQT
ncbi:uncharacterized protein LOC119613022 [Lucilia sericata]|uniref:uncharacterized protein LOC119613022 n=1 Tax=Lucilia sericata TaxID=13632 RepID=UPI0018A7FCFF|nr:uncharacterized protein LOC119613022 [Lucilia sericata]